MSSAFADLEVVITVRGVKREDGKTAAEVEAELAAAAAVAPELTELATPDTDEVTDAE